MSELDDKPIILDTTLDKDTFRETDNQKDTRTQSYNSSSEKYSLSRDVSITITDTASHETVTNGSNTDQTENRRDRFRSDSSSILDTSANSPKDEERRGTITKKIPLSEFATLQGILAHQVDEGAPCLKCGPDECSGLELHFWKKVCKNCGCPRGSHKIQKLIEEKKEVPKSILLQTADEDEEDYKELTVAAPPSKLSIKGKSDSHKVVQYNEEYVNSLREFYKDKRHNLNIPADKKLTAEQLVALQHYINQTQGEQVISSEVLQAHLHHLVRDQQLDKSDTPDQNRSRSNSSHSEGTDSLPLDFLQALQLVQLSKDGSLYRPSSTSPNPLLNHPGYHASTMPNIRNGRADDYSAMVNEEDEYSKSYSDNERTGMNIPTKKPGPDDSTIEMIDRLTDVSKLQPTEAVISVEKTSPKSSLPRPKPLLLTVSDVLDSDIDREMESIPETLSLPEVEQENVILEKSVPDFNKKIEVVDVDDFHDAYNHGINQLNNQSAPYCTTPNENVMVVDNNYLKPDRKKHHGREKRFRKKRGDWNPKFYPSSPDSTLSDGFDGPAVRGVQSSRSSVRSYNEDDSLEEYKMWNKMKQNYDRHIPKENYNRPRDRLRSYDLPKRKYDHRSAQNRLSLPPRYPGSRDSRDGYIPRTQSLNKNDRRSYTESSGSDSESDRETPPPKPVRRNPESFDDMTQGDIVDYYTTVSPSGDYRQELKRKGSPGVWVPPGLHPTIVKQYLAALPEDKRPVNTLGVQWRIKQLQTQLPRYDHNINYCHEMSPEEQEELFLFVENRKERAQGQGQVKTFKKKEKKKCDKCGGLIECGIIADKVPGKVYHPGCFTCGTCNEILVDLIYFQLNGELHCGRHHAELLRPRCHACDELIFGFEFITADGHEYHKEHFCCWECDSSLGGTKYVSHKGQPYCQICYEKLFCTRCVSCKEPIGVGVPVYKHGPLRWHGNPTCYSCSFCKRSLVNRTFMPTERFVYCSKNCFRCHESLRKTKGK